MLYKTLKVTDKTGVRTHLCFDYKDRLTLECTHSFTERLLRAARSRRCGVTRGVAMKKETSLCSRELCIVGGGGTDSKQGNNAVSAGDKCCKIYVTIR